ncbi:MAG: hypothetical protein JXQ73_10025 [Phycisphaerae bacterium]|nr:hypothetical protein [Phycisphaerae bacterium]
MSANRVAGSFMAMLCIALAAGQVGCIPPQANNPPTANAGADQTVNTGDTVNLAGTGTDPDGDTLTYAWVQTVGTAVTLAGPNTATPSFTAPNSADVLAFNMTVNDGKGGSATDAVVVTVQAGGTPPPATTPQLFIVNSLGNNVVSYENPSAINGNIAPDTNLAGVSTQLAGPLGVAVNAAGELMVLNTTPSVTSYANASATNGNLVPDGNLSGPSTLLAAAESLALNTTRDVLFVANALTDQIFVYDLAGGTLNGNLAPPRIIGTAPGGLTAPRALCADASGNLYVVNGGGSKEVLVFANAENLNGIVTATRTITSAAFVNICDVFVDGNDTLFVVDPGATGVHSFAGAAAINGAIAPTRTLTVPGLTFLAAIVVDSNDVGYIADIDPGSNAIYVYDNISTLNANLAPDRTIAGSNTQLSWPADLFLVE